MHHPNHIVAATKFTWTGGHWNQEWYDIGHVYPADQIDDVVEQTADHYRVLHEDDQDLVVTVEGHEVNASWTDENGFEHEERVHFRTEDPQWG